MFLVVLEARVLKLKSISLKAEVMEGKPGRNNLELKDIRKMGSREGQSRKEQLGPEGY